MADRIWKAALYIRLSREDEDCTGESNSITSQRQLLLAFLAQHPDMELYDIYADDGFSGTSFDRPDFRRMIRDIEDGKVSCVIVKDLSRFGRNASKTGYYLDEYFVLNGIRFIAVQNYIDTAASGQSNAATNCITLGITNVINESYAAQTSVSVRSTLNLERKQGKFIGSFACYGYRKDPDDHHRLIIDEPAAEIVRQIFDWFLGGKSILGIAKQLNAMGIPNPSAYKQQNGLNYRQAQRSDGLWPDSSVRRILQNRMYIGDMIQGKNQKLSFKHRMIRAMPQEDWIVVEGTHEPIIDREVFEKAQALFNRQIRKSPHRDEVDLFAGLVRCADCGRRMTKKTNVHPYGTYSYYRCTTSVKMNASACSPHSIRIDKLEQAVLVTLQTMIATVIEMSKLLEVVRENSRHRMEHSRLESALEAACARKEKLLLAQADLYPDWKSGILEREEYLRLKSRLAEQVNAAEQNIAAIERSISELHPGQAGDSDFLTVFKKYGNIRALTRPMLLELVEEILVHEKGCIEVHFKYRDAFREMQNYLMLSEADPTGTAAPQSYPSDLPEPHSDV